MRKISDHLSADTIRAAIQGDTAAMCLVLDYYEPYLKKLSLCTFYDAEGNPVSMVNESHFKHLQMQLMLGILKFRVSAA